VTARIRTEPTQLRGAETLQKLRAAAHLLYNDPEIGRDRITTTMVAHRANVSIGTVYRYWTDRVAMLDDIAPDRDRSSIHRINNPGGEAVCEHGFNVTYLCTNVQELTAERHEHNQMHHHP